MQSNNKIKRVISLEPLSIRNIAYLNTKLILIKEKYEDYTTKNKESELHQQIEKIKRKINKLKKSTPETEKEIRLPLIYNTNDKLIEAFIQRKVIYEMETYIKNELSYQKKEIENISIIKKSEFNIFLKENFDIKCLFNKIDELKNDELLKNRNNIFDEFFILTLKFIETNRKQKEIKKDSIDFLEKNYYKFLKTQIINKVSIDSISKYIIKSYKKIFIYKGLPIYGIIYILIRSGMRDLLKEFILNNEILKEYKEVFEEESLFKNIINLINNNKIENRISKIKTKDCFYEILLEILTPNSLSINNKLSNLITSFEDFLFYRLITKQEYILNKELESIKSTKNVSLYLFAKMLTNEYDNNRELNNESDLGFQYLLESRDLLKIYSFLYYNYKSETPIREKYIKYFIDLSLKLAEITEVIEKNKLFLMLIPIPDSFKNYLITKLANSSIDFSYILEQDISLKTNLIKKLENSNKRSIILRNKKLINDYEKYLKILVEDFLSFLISETHLKYEFIKQIKEEKSIISKYKDILNILSEIYTYFLEPTIENLKKTLISNPILYKIVNMDILIERLILNSISLIKKNNEQILARNIIELMEIYNININQIGEEFVMLI